jgi:hypothetical protein
METKLPEWRHICLVLPLTREWDLDPVERTIEARGQRVRNLDHATRVVRDVAFRLIVVPQAEVEAELDLGWDVTADPNEPLEYPRLRVSEPDRDVALQHPELDVRVPLECQLLRWKRSKDLRELIDHRRLVGLLDESLVPLGDERTDRRERRRQADLEAAAGWNDTVPLEERKGPVGRDRRFGVTERAEAELRGLVMRPQPQAGQRAVGARRGWCDLELRPRAEHRVLPHDPVGAWPGLAVRQATDAVAQATAEPAEDVLRTSKRDAADEMGA